jgi:hypothetical protein
MWSCFTWPTLMRIPNRSFEGCFPEVIPFQQTLAVPGLELGMQPRIEVEVVSVKPDLINRETLEAAVTLRNYQLM